MNIYAAFAQSATHTASAAGTHATPTAVASQALHCRQAALPAVLGELGGLEMLDASAPAAPKARKAKS